MQLKVDNFFKELTGFEAYSFQKKVFDSIINKKNVILQIPTGGGKTWSALAPFIFSWNNWKLDNENADNFPKKLIYSLPLRTLANSIYKNVAENDLIKDLGLLVSLQTGENPQDRFFESDIIFTTIDQTLSNALGIPLSLSNRLGNINAGAVFTSYLIFDEFHLLDPNRSLETTILLLKKLKNITPFCLMTATLTDVFIEKISSTRELNAEIIKVDEEEYSKFAFVKKNVKKSIQVFETSINVRKILEEHKNKSIVICNTVDRCKLIFKEISELANDEVELICIHSQFFQKDRKEKEKKILRLFGKESENENVILVSTQVIEVGLDISCEKLHSEISPINSLVQRFGRCVRWGGKGEIFIYDLEENEKGEKIYLPYEESLCQQTFDCLKKFRNENIDFFNLQKMINEILTESERKSFMNLSESTNFQKIEECWRDGGKEKARNLIRNINSINVVLLPKGRDKINSLYHFESISINPFSLRSKLKKISENPEENVYLLVEDSFVDFDEPKVLENLTDIDNLHLHNIVALNPKVVSYSKEFGLDFDSKRENISISPQISDYQKIPQYAIKMDTYQQHIYWMIKCFEKGAKRPESNPLELVERKRFTALKDDSAFVIQKLKSILGLDFNFEEIIKFIIIMHDFGKLDKTWQAIANEYQKAKNLGDNFKPKILAHTDSDGENDKKLFVGTCKKFGRNKFPEHAGVGAEISRKLLPNLMQMEKTKGNQILLKAVMTSIIKHHSRKTFTTSGYSISKENLNFLNEKLLKKIISDFYIKSNLIDEFLLSGKANDLKSSIVIFDNFKETVMYFIFVRILRLCDQHSFEENTK